MADLARLYRLDLTDPASWGRPWAPVRNQILSLLNEPTSRLRADLGGGD